VALNRLACEFCGVQAEHEALGKTDWELFPQSRVPEYLADDRGVLESGVPLTNRLEPTPEREGSPELLVTNKIPLRDAAGNVVGVAGISRKVSQVRYAPGVVQRLARVLEYLHAHAGEAVLGRELARLAGLSESQFERTFRKTFGLSPRQYLIRIRVEQACRLLRETDLTLAAVAVECGFYDHAHLSRAFTEQMGETPSRYRGRRQVGGG
jgi:AraC-like DNA-binding protein